MFGASSGAGDEDLHEQVRRLTELVEAQQQRLAVLEGRTAPDAPHAPDAPSRPPAATAPPSLGGAAADRSSAAVGPAAGDLPDRRALLRRVGAAAAGAVTGGAALAVAGAGPAAAVNGDAVTVGQTKTGTLTTGLTWTGAAIADTGPAVLLVKDFNNAAANDLGATILGYRLAGGADSKGVAGVNTGDGIGVYGQGDTGVRGVGAGGGVGVRAEGGYAVTATSTTPGGVGVYVDATNTQLVLKPGAADPTVPSTSRLAGSVVTDTAGALWFCTAGGTPGTWRKLSGPGTAGVLHVLPAPKRVFDSRAGNLPNNVAKGAFVNQTKVIDAKNNGSGVPAGATAVLVNLAVTNTVNGGYGALWANGVADPGTASINWSATATSISNSVVAAVDATGLLLCKIAGTADVIIDVVGYYR